MKKWITMSALIVAGMLAAPALSTGAYAQTAPQNISDAISTNAGMALAKKQPTKKADATKSQTQTAQAATEGVKNTLDQRAAAAKKAKKPPAAQPTKH